MDVYINDISAFLPNGPVTNDEMEAVLGMINNIPSRTRKIVLRNNNIKTRYYAIDPASGRPTHTNAQLTAEAVRRLDSRRGFLLNDIQYLCCGTSSPDQIMPGHGLMVQGELGIGPCEVVSTSGICLSGVTALKNAYMNVAMGFTENGVATGSEMASSFTRSQMGQSIDPQKIDEIHKRPVLSFEEDFLRWMLSDGAGAIFLSNSPLKEGLSLKIEWIEILSYANEFSTCMYAGAGPDEGSGTTGWREYSSLHEAVNRGVFNIKQDVKLLNENIVTVSVNRALKHVVKKYSLEPDRISWFLPHYSSNYFRKPLMDRMHEIGFGIPESRWFTNLEYKGNTGAASIYIILEELFHSGKIRKGDSILCFVPESGRFSIGYMMFTAC
ncbi:MAG: beta-ketoacyl-ACP synthase III [Deltaproteobacteria bacterium]|nr:beta-ketoacyl-ACP synthase III [Deltaproteobacteria bacterium]